MIPAPDTSTAPTGVSRRRVLFDVIGTVAAIGAGVAGSRSAEHLTSGTVLIESFSSDGHPLAVAPVARIVKTDRQWQTQLSPLAFEVTRCGGTERPFCGGYLHNHEPGLYRCVCCYTALFAARTKFDSDTGWPSFWAPAGRYNLVELADDSYGMHRTAVSCRRCAAHLGHVFADGPPPTGLRYCINSVALRFVPRTKI